METEECIKSMQIATVRLRNSSQICHIDGNNIFIKPDSLGVVETEHGVDIGRVIKGREGLKKTDVEIKGKLLRKLTDEDYNSIPEIEAIEEKAFYTCREKAKKRELKMKLISVKCLFDKTKIVFYFVAENRIDFRELVRELASIFRTRIEMRQIGVRDETKIVGGYGQCGREHCCSHQWEDFDPVSIKMAKEQNLNLNSLKISGICGRLLCCLGYEYNTYREFNIQLPKTGSEIFAGSRSFKVESFDTLSETFTIRDGDRNIKLSKYEIHKPDDRFMIRKELLPKVFSDNDPSEGNH
jgi:cell fate regulator YaaT (PSP1 superfamily)